MFMVRCLCWVGGLIAVLGFCGAAAAMQAEAIFSFDLARMPLHEALQKYSSLTGRSVIYDSDQTRGRYSSALRGQYALDDALGRLIAGSGMEISYATPRAVSLIIAPSAQSGRFAIAPSTASRSARQRYYGRLQAKLRHLLCADPALEAGAYRLVLQFRITPTPPSVDLLHVIASGRPELEPMILAALHGQALDAPPPGFGQPVTLLIPARSGQQEGGCAP